MSDQPIAPNESIEPIKTDIEPLDTVAVIEKELLKTQEEAAVYKDKYFRALAEMENLRKTHQKEITQRGKLLQEEIIRSFLPPLDGFEQAMKFAEKSSEEVKSWAQGFEMIVRQFQEVLQALGVTAYYALNQPFDPYLHEAIDKVEDDTVAPGTVIQEYAKGYKISDRILRPAKVKVAQTTSETIKN